MNILLIDNYDSFTYNLKSLIERSVPGYSISVKRNQDKTITELDFDMLVVSPGPMTWKQTGVLKYLFLTRIIPDRIPFLGICLGMQFLAGFYGLNVDKVKNPVHGSQSVIIHSGDRLFKGIPSEFKAARYNSLGLYKTDSEDLEFIAFEKDSGSVMALKHRTLPFAGLQFHPESFLTEHGEKIIKNFIDIYV